MYDFMTDTAEPGMHRAEILFLSNPLGAAGEWKGLADTMGGQSITQTIVRPADLQPAIWRSFAGVHLVAHGSSASHALRMALSPTHPIQSLTLIDPDILPALSDLHDCPTYRRNLRLVATATACVERGQPVEAAQKVVDWWMGRSAWARTSTRLQRRFAAGMPRLVSDWRVQSETPIALADLAAIACPIQILTGRRVPGDIQNLCHILRIVLPQATVIRVPGARGACHLSHPHLVGPQFRNFVVDNDWCWQSEPQKRAA
ncbi:MAG: hypothetical protein AAFR35_10025 [Pseudomonadota bacterium]